MTITADELARIRYWAPTTWTPTAVFNDAAVEAVWDREANTDTTTTEAEAKRQSWANVYTVALILTERLMAGMVADPDSFSVASEYSESRGAAINMLMQQRANLRVLKAEATAAFDGTDAITSQQVCRPNYLGR